MDVGLAVGLLIAPSDSRGVEDGDAVGDAVYAVSMKR